jgi:hypothetical protein
MPQFIPEEKPVEKPVEKPKPKQPEEMPVETVEKAKKIVKKKKLKLKKKERRGDQGRSLLYLTVLGIIAIILFTEYVEQVNPVFSWIIILFGMMAFLPLGLLLGKLFLDPYVRCKIMRRMGNRNYGVVHFIQKGGKRIELRIKNLTDDVIVQGTKLWVLEDAGIYYSDRNDDIIFHSKISPENFITSPNNVPMLFLDVETMLPLRFHKPDTKWLTNPQQVGATTLGYINNQIAKNLFFKKSMTMFYLIILVLQVVNIVGLIILYDELVGL